MADIEKGEEWKVVPGYDGIYEASSFGRVRSAPLGRELKQQTKGLYPRVSLCNPGTKKFKLWLTHRVVAAAFLGPAPEKHDVNHIDGNKFNNRATNLEYATRRENQVHYQKTIRKKALPTGVTFHTIRGKTRYLAQIQINGKQKSLGRYDTPEEAESAYLKAKSAEGIK